MVGCCVDEGSSMRDSVRFNVHNDEASSHQKSIEELLGLRVSTRTAHTRLALHGLSREGDNSGRRRWYHKEDSDKDNDNDAPMMT